MHYGDVECLLCGIVTKGHDETMAHFRNHFGELLQKGSGHDDELGGDVPCEVLEGGVVIQEVESHEVKRTYIRRKDIADILIR